ADVLADVEAEVLALVDAEVLADVDAEVLALVDADVLALADTELDIKLLSVTSKRYVSSVLAPAESVTVTVTK
ncbi:TPA: hypothetical protein U1087_002264, partial [Streptococcus suis]|nr:hypothetical protein [Streptococcus suis]